MRISPDGGAAINSLNRATDAMSAYEAASSPAPVKNSTIAADEARGQAGTLQQTESAAIDQTGQLMLERYQSDTHDFQATATQMEGDKAGFAKVTQELSAELPTHAGTINAVAWTLGAVHDAGQAEAEAGHAHADAGAIASAGILQLNSAFQGAAADKPAAEVVAFALQSADVQRMVSSAVSAGHPGDGSAQGALNTLHATLSGVADDPKLSQAARSGVRDTMTRIEDAGSHDELLKMMEATKDAFDEEVERSRAAPPPKQSDDEIPEQMQVKRAMEDFKFDAYRGTQELSQLSKAH